MSKTDRRKSKRWPAEDQQQASALLDALFESAPVGLGFWDTELRFRRLNARLAEMNGLPAEAHLGKRPDELFLEIEGLEEILAQWRQVIETGRPLTDVEVHGNTSDPDPEPHTWLEHFFPVRLRGETIGLGAVIEDVTERRRAQDALLRQRLLLETIVERMPMAVCLIRGGDLRVQLANSAYLAISPGSKVLDRTLDEIWLEERYDFGSACRRVLETGAPHVAEDEPFPHCRSEDAPAETPYFTWALHRVPWPGEQGFGLLNTVWETTARKRAEQALRDADRRKDEFLAVLGHELRNPLAPLLAGVELLESARAKPELIDSLRPMMARQLEHLTRLVDDLLDMTRITRGRAELKRVRLDLRDVLEAAVEQARPEIAARGHALEVDLGDDALPVDGDFQRLTQVLVNLLSNASKYSEPAGRITVESRRLGDEAVVQVTDAGFGIPAEHLKDLFEMFSQIPEHRTLIGGGGLGIGLAISRQLVELHGGTIHAASEGVGAGSEFVVRLPLMSASARDPELRASDAEQGARPGRRVLVVDDNADAAESLRILLEGQGHDVHAVYDGVSAVEAVRAFEPEVILLDLGLPRMSGFEVAQRVRAEPGGAAVRIVALTGWGQAQDRERTRAAGFDEHLTKPVDSARLKALIG